MTNAEREQHAQDVALAAKLWRVLGPPDDGLILLQKIRGALTAEEFAVFAMRIAVASHVAQQLERGDFGP